MLLCTDYGVDKYDIGTGFGHFGLAVEDVRWQYESLFNLFTCRMEMSNNSRIITNFLMFHIHDIVEATAPTKNVTNLGTKRILQVMHGGGYTSGP